MMWLHDNNHWVTERLVQPYLQPVSKKKGKKTKKEKRKPYLYSHEIL